MHPCTAICVRLLSLQIGVFIEPEVLLNSLLSLYCHFVIDSLLTSCGTLLGIRRTAMEPDRPSNGHRGFSLSSALLVVTGLAGISTTLLSPLRHLGLVAGAKDSSLLLDQISVRAFLRFSQKLPTTGLQNPVRTFSFAIPIPENTCLS